MTCAVVRAIGLIAALSAVPATAHAGVLDHVRAAGIVRCGAVIRPGLAFPATDGTWHGLEVEMCRAVAAAVLGDADRIAMRSYLTGDQFAHAADGEDDVAFLTASEMSANLLFGRVLPGLPVFYQTTRIMVRDESLAHHVTDLASTQVCAEPGTGPERNLQDYMGRHAIAFRFSMWQEVEEMMDAFAVGRCPAVAGEETALAALRFSAEEGGRKALMLPEALAASPVSIATAASDPAWAQIVSWTVQTVMAARHEPRVQGPALPVPGAALGLQDGWQDRVVAAVGTYADVFDRTLGANSPLDLPPGLNTSWDQGGLFAPPTVE